VEWRREYDYPPSLEDLRARLGWRSKATVYKAVQRLAGAGYVRQAPRGARTLVLLALPADYPGDWSVVHPVEAPLRHRKPPRPFEDWEKGVMREVGNGSIGELRLLFPRRTLREIRELAALCGVKLVSS
jgi:hypothetical protein